MFPELTHHRPPYTWHEYTPLLSQPEKLEKIFKDNPLFVIHPGFRNYYPDERLNGRAPEKLYTTYLKNLAHKTKQALRQSRTIFVYSPTKYLNPTLSAINYPPKAILIPTTGRSTNLDPNILGPNTHKFYSTLIHLGLTKAKIIGEYQAQCLGNVKSQLARRGVEVTQIDSCVYPPRCSLPTQ